jgi:hypothetical protein
MSLNVAPLSTPPRTLSASSSHGSLLSPKPQLTDGHRFPSLGTLGVASGQQQQQQQSATAPTTPAASLSRSTCGECETIPAGYFCASCSAFLCQGCSAQVHKARIHRSHAVVPLPVPSCAECSAPASRYCGDCDCGSGANLCTQHAQTVHSFRVTNRHRVMPLADKATFLNGRSTASAGYAGLAAGGFPAPGASPSASRSSSLSRSASRTPSTSLPGSHISLKSMRSKILTDNTHAADLQRFLEGIPVSRRLTACAILHLAPSTLLLTSFGCVLFKFCFSCPLAFCIVHRKTVSATRIGNLKCSGWVQP